MYMKLALRMFIKSIVIIASVQFRFVQNYESAKDYFEIYMQDENYRGEKFPEKYLHIDDVRPSEADVHHYMQALGRLVGFFVGDLNSSDPNVALGSFFTKAVMKRTLIDYGHKLNDEIKYSMKNIINRLENITSHFIYDSLPFGPKDLGFQLANTLKDDESLVSSIEKFNRKIMQKWIKSAVKLNTFIESMDNMTMPRELYVLQVSALNVNFTTDDSDYCITSVSSQPRPIRKDEQLKSCQRVTECRKAVLKMPSVAYVLSHRMLYLLLTRMTRRCYVISEEADRMHLDIMCANMYRETVYLARKGHFFRDLFMEHITLCALLGYEEFHRRNWFQKVASWVNEEGCLQENHNFIVNRTILYVSRAKTRAEVRRLKRKMIVNLIDECQTHQMILATNVLAHGIKHAAHYMLTS